MPAMSSAAIAWLSTDPDVLYAVEDPIGPENDRYILQGAQETGKVIVAWGALGGFENRCHAVFGTARRPRCDVPQKDDGRLSDPPSLCRGRY